MGVFERFFQPSPEELEILKEVEELRKLHPDFQELHGPWLFNEGDGPHRPTLKIRFAFRDPALLDDCQFYAKIGINKDTNIAEPYIGFAYGSGSTKDELETWAQKFPYAELIVGLDYGGVITPKSEVVILKQEQPKNTSERKPQG